MKKLVLLVIMAGIAVCAYTMWERREEAKRPPPAIHFTEAQLAPLVTSGGAANLGALQALLPSAAKLASLQPYDVEHILEQLTGRLAGARVLGVFPIDETIYARQVQWFAPVGQGIVDWPGWLRLLREMRYTGWAVFELDAAPDPVLALRQIKQYVEGALLHIYR